MILEAERQRLIKALDESSTDAAMRVALESMPLRLNLAVLKAAAIDLRNRSQALVVLAEILLAQTDPEKTVEPTL